MKSFTVHSGHLLMTIGLLGIITSAAIIFHHATLLDAYRVVTGGVGTLTLLVVVSRIK